MKNKKECVIANEVKKSQTHKSHRILSPLAQNDINPPHPTSPARGGANVDMRSISYSGREVKAFTLAEVLITLGIIGVVAAMTIPTLMQKTNDKELVSGTLKMGTTLSNALKSMEALDMVGVNKLSDLETFDAKFRKQFKTVNCTDHNVCLADGGYFDYVNPQFGGACDKETPCLEINADINGKKGPNKDGKDRYTFLVTYRGIIPLGETETCSGLDCTAYVLANHKLWDGEINPVENATEEGVDPCTYYDEHGTCRRGDGAQLDVESGERCYREGSTAAAIGSGDTMWCVNGVWN